MVTSLISHNIPISHKKVIIFLVSIWQKIYIWIYKRNFVPFGRENSNIWEYIIFVWKLNETFLVTFPPLWWGVVVEMVKCEKYLHDFYARYSSCLLLIFKA